ncbi:ZmpA/ZmpB/ZmpC family metallo-endopeptidase [Dolosigranulum pigrum]|uniref:ZmpA/ZmpB/ZmpC family metallo-endopeptidase n=1 Tax=Dolosigranulum pigrum TaxID=29394 RepID=UPI000DCF77A0|nr:ZmpA/ZmpB/ZmpC family metallo-endopeptidase [Dolosigranulum pigrum]
MVSKNNKMELFQKQANKAKRYTLKKLSIGVTSVATGTVLFLGHANSVSANESMNEEQVTVTIIDENIVRTEDLSNEVASEGEESVDSSDLNDSIGSNHPIEEEHISNQNLNQFVLVARERANRYIPNLPNLTEDQKVHYTNRVNAASSVAEIEKVYEDAMSVLPIVEEQPSEAVVPPNRYVVVVRDRALNIISALENLYDAQKEDYKKQIQGASRVSEIEAIISEAEGVINTSVGDEEAPQISKGKLEEPESNHSPIEQEPKEKYPGNAQTPEKPEHKVQYGKQEERIQKIIDYSIEYTEDPELYVGQERLITPGIQGVTEIIRVYETADGRVTGRVLSEEVNVISASQKQVVARGTKPISGIEEVVEEVTIDPETSKVYDSTLYLGESTFVPGESGRKKVTTVYKTLYGKRTEEVLKTTEEVLIPATNHVLRQGTKAVNGEETVVEEVTVVAPTVEEETDDFYVGEGEKVEGSDGLKRVTRVYRTVKGKKTDEIIRESEEVVTAATPHILRKGTKPVDGQAVVTEEVAIQPGTKTVETNDLYVGEMEEIPGEPGLKKVTITYKTAKGNQTKEVLHTSETVIKEATPTIIRQGTKAVNGEETVVEEVTVLAPTVEEETDDFYVGEGEKVEGSDGLKRVTRVYRTVKGKKTDEIIRESEEVVTAATPHILRKGTKPVDGSQAVVTEEVIQPETIEQKDSNLYEGEERVVDGSVGRKKVTTTYKTHKGELTEEVLGVNEETIEDARPTIIYKGTKSLEGTKNVISEEVIQPETILEEDNGLYEGEERVVKGTPGLKQITKTYKTYKGELTEEVLAIKEEIIEKSSPKIVYKGTKAVVGSEEVVTEEVIQPKTIEQEDSNLYVGEQDITDGIVGRKRVTKTYKTIKGERTNDVLDTKEETLVKAQPKIVRNGTKAVDGTEDVVTYETIQPDTREETDNNLYVGEARTVDGSVGRRQVTTTYKTHKGKRIEQVVNVSTETLEAARPTVIYRGTKPVEGTEEVVSYEVIKPGRSEETDDGLYEDEQRVVQGSPGRLEVTTTYKTHKGKRTEEVVNRSERTVEAAQPTITYVGTKPVEGTEEVVTYETIEPEIETVQTDELYEGEEDVTEGKVGRKEITTTYKTHKGKRTDDVVNESTRTLEEAQPKIVRQGTKPVNGREEVVTEERIEPEIIEREDDSLPEGETVTEQGTPGTRRITKVYKTVRGERTTEEVLDESSEVTQEAKPTIVRKGVRFEAPTLENAHFISDAMNRTARLSYTLNNPSNLEVSGTIRVSRDGETVRDVPVSNFNEITINDLDVNTPYQFEARLTYTRGDQEQDISAHIETHTLSMNQIELKSLTKTTLVRRGDDGQLREFSELNEAPTDLSNYFIRAQASHMKDIVLPVASINAVERNGDVVYEVRTSSEDTVHRDGDKFKSGSVFYVNKYKAPENGVYYNFKDLIHAMTNNPRGTFTLGRTLSASGVEPLGRKTYIQTDFRGTLSGLHNGKRHRIEGLEHGLFTKVNGGQIRDIDFTGVNIVYPDSWEGDYISSLAGDLTNGGVIENVNVQGYIEGRDHVSGLVNTMSNQSRIENVSFIGRIKSRGGNSISGAIAGTNNHSIVTRAYVDADMEMHRPKDASLLVAITTSDQGRAGRWGKTTKSVVKGSMRSNLRGKMAAISTSAWGYATVSDVVSYATIQNGHELFGSDEQLKDSGPAYRNIGPVYGVQNVSNGSVKGSDEKFERLSPTDAARKVREFDLSAIDQLSRDTPAEELNGHRRYASVSGYVASHEAFYRFVEALQPFSLVEDIVREGNALAQSDKRPTWMAEGKELKSITALKGNEFVTSGDDADQIMLQFTDGTKLMYGLTNKKAVDLFKDKHTSGNGYHLSQYQVEGLGVTYTMNRLSNVSRELVESLTRELGSVGLYNREMYQMLKINEKNEKAKENRMKKLFLDEIFEETKANLSSILDKLIQNEMVMLSSSDVAVNALKDKITTHKKQIMMALTYLNRYYNIRFGDYNIKDLMMYLPEFYSGQGGSLIDRLIKLGSSTEYQLHGRRTHEFFNREFGAPMGTNLLDFLNFNRELFTEFDNMNDWFKDATKENVKLIERAPLAEGLKAQNPKYRVFDNLSHGYYHHTILPLLNLRKAKMFMISTIASLTFGSEQKRAYLNEAQLKKEIETAGDRHRDFIDSWYKIANDETKDRLMRDRVTPIWEGFHLHERGWVNEFGKDNRGQDYAPSREFYNVIGEYYGSNGTGAYANGTLIHFVVYDYLGEGGHATWSHEMTHNYDGLVFLGGPGRRNGVGAEAYASGMLQSPGQNGGGYGGLGVNLSYSWEDDGNNIYNSDPKKFHNQEMWDKYMKGYNDALTLLDYLEGEAAIKAGRDVQRHWFKKMGKTDIRATRFTDHVRPLTDEEWRNLNLQSVNDLVDNQLMTKHGLNNGTYSQDNDWGTYITVDYLTGIYGGGDNSKGVPGAAMFKHNTFRVWGRYGYENGFVGYASNKHREQALNDGHAQLSDDYAINKISGGKHQTMEDFKKDYFNDMITQLKTKGMIDIQIDGVQYSSYDSLAKKFSQTVQADTKARRHDHTRTFKGKLFKALLHNTDNFLSSIFKG